MVSNTIYLGESLFREKGDLREGLLSPTELAYIYLLAIGSLQWDPYWTTPFLISFK